MAYLALEASACVAQVRTNGLPSLRIKCLSASICLHYTKYQCSLRSKCLYLLYTQYSYYVALKASAYVPSTKQYTV